ncbi:hypothetical protein LCI18_008385 [Fusarium solani-melongenae]|uniref:Uncharacterized protein n=1 Tax=Fusarium solani subsp. cucurbitae TaxID=2747967 RepID=A0ACD3Z8K4_FUSSC|nr:hypothetical protein LCI18_008385 [Fusarium solani-melongenae]
MPQAKENRIHKRSGTQNGELAKRRAPYALRACDACRRRKGKCDGRQPCGHCSGRGQDCSYSSSFAPEGWQPTAVVAADRATGRSGNRRHGLAVSYNRDALVEMLSTLQEQLDTLTSQVRPSTQVQLDSPSPTLAADCSGDENFIATLINDASASQNNAHTAKQQSRGSAQHFYGPTSPDYSLNVAQLKLRRNSFPGAPLQQRQFQLATIDEDASDEDEVADTPSPAMPPRVLDCEALGRLLQFRSFLDLQEAIRFLHVYQEVVGDLHPLIDLNEVISLARCCYTDPESVVWNVSARKSGAASDENLVILNLALAIALRADSNPESSSFEILIRNCFQDAVNAKLGTAPHSIRHVTIILLNGFYEFFQDMPRSAWRMCGIAGHMLMELGFHNGEVSKHLLELNAQREEAWNLISCILIIDRQWSSATGLPTHFNNSSFSSIPMSCIKNPHVKAMHAFILISDKFSEPIAQAAKGEGYSDDEAFELMSFQIEQWRKKAVGEHVLSQSDKWQTEPSTKPPTWSILLNLRAESVRSLLLKPFFFSESDPGKITKHIRPATELVFKVVNVLYTLDTTTDIYRKQHPNYQHLLASAIALAFLLVALIEQHRTDLLPSLSPDLLDSLSRSFEMAVTLTDNYVKTSRAARRLSKRLCEMRGILLNLGLLNRSSSGDVAGIESTQRGTARATQKTPFSQNPQLFPSFTSPFTTRETSVGLGTVFPTTSDIEIQPRSSWTDSLRFQWPVGDTSTIFSEGIF